MAPRVGCAKVASICIVVSVECDGYQNLKAESQGKDVFLVHNTITLGLSQIHSNKVALFARTKPFLQVLAYLLAYLSDETSNPNIHRLYSVATPLHNLQAGLTRISQCKNHISISSITNKLLCLLLKRRRKTSRDFPLSI